jgi:hypothetical protein
VTVTPEERPAEVEAPEASACPRCGAEVDAAQEYCLECGLRLPRREGLVAGLGDAWQRRLPWYPGDWVWPALACLVIAALGAALAILSTRDGSSDAARTLVATTSVLSRSITTTPVAPEQTVAKTTAPATTLIAPGSGPPPPKPKPQGLVQWPATRSGYTLVLGSIPKPGLASATAEARKAIASGLENVGVLDSDRFSSLHPGYLVVFSGFYGSFSEANAAVGRAHADGYRLAYPRSVTR